MQIGNITLRDYQVKAVERFRELTGCLIAFDKRGGKTMTSLSLAQQLYDTGDVGPTLIVTDRVSPWTRDFDKIGLESKRLFLVDRPRRTTFTNAIEKMPRGNCNFYQIHWAGLGPMAKELSSVRWLNIIADEAHRGKNRKAQRTKALKRLRTAYKAGLTADPGDNMPDDIWSLLNWLYPKKYSSYWRFVEEYMEIEEHYGRSGKYRVCTGVKNVEKFQEEIAQFYISLTLEEIDPGQIPNKYEERLVDMSPEQRRAYEDMVELQVARLGDDLLIADFPMIAAMRLQQFAQAMGRMETHKEWKTKQKYDSAKKKKVPVKELVDVVSVHQIEPSTKLDDLIECLHSPENYGVPTIIFTQFRDMVDLACQRMNKAGLSYVKVVGGDDVEAAEKEFQEGRADIIIGTTSMISESIELDRADIEIFLDVPPNPRVRSQAEGRGKAVGKRRQIRVIDIKTRDSVDRAKLDRTLTKGQWIDELLGRNNR